MEILKDKYSITELSERLNVTTHALRYYEKEFGLVIPKDGRGRRYYTTEMANIMFQIKTMRDDGLEIKAIRKILQSEDSASEPPPVVLDDGSSSLVPLSQNGTSTDIKLYFDDFKDEISQNISAEMASAKEYIAREINKTKLELGACVENSVRKLESKMEKHFTEVDRMLGSWREKNRGGSVKRFINKLFK